MQKQNRAAFVLLGINLLTLILLGCVNSVIGQHESFFTSLPFSFFQELFAWTIREGFLWPS